MWDWISETEKLRQAGQPFAIVTVAHVAGSTPREPGAKMLVGAQGRIKGTIGGGTLEIKAIADAQLCLSENATRLLKYPLCIRTGQCCGGSVELLVEVLNPPPKVYVFGAGHVGQAVCRTLAGTPFAVHAIDERTEWIDHPDLPAETSRTSGSWRSFVDAAKWSETQSYAVVMTHLHALDLEILEVLLTKKTRYIGLIGSETKWLRFQMRLKSAGFAEADIARITCPLGVPVGGGKNPQEIAISLAAQLLQLHYTGGGLAKPIPA